MNFAVASISGHTHVYQGWILIIIFGFYVIYCWHTCTSLLHLSLPFLTLSTRYNPTSTLSLGTNIYPCYMIIIPILVDMLILIGWRFLFIFWWTVVAYKFLTWLNNPFIQNEWNWLHSWNCFKVCGNNRNKGFFGGVHFCMNLLTNFTWSFSSST